MKNILPQACCYMMVLFNKSFSWCCLLLFLFFSHALRAQQVVWVHSLKGTYSGNFRLSATDRQGNIFVHGEYTGTIQHGTTSLPGAYPANYDLVHLKYGPDRGALWYKKNKGFKNGISTAAITDREGNLYELTGFTSGVFDNILYQPEGSTAYITKFSRAGERLWIKFMKGGFIYPSQLFLDADGNILFSVNVEGGTVL